MAADSSRVGNEVYSSPEKAALAKCTNTLAVSAAWDQNTVIQHPQKVVYNPRRTSDALRQDMKMLGAFFLARTEPPQTSFGLDPFKGAGTAEIHPKSWERLEAGHPVCCRCYCQLYCCLCSPLSHV